jgi:GT2 family glycosyltransferase
MNPDNSVKTTTLNQLIGSFDLISQGCAYGWVFDKSDPEKAITVQALVGTKVLAESKTYLERPDLKGMRAGFKIPLPAHCFKVDACQIHVVVKETGHSLPGGPITLNVEDRFSYFIDGFVDRSTISGWLKDHVAPEAAKRLTVQLLEDDTVIASSLCGGLIDESGEIGRFSLVLPASVLAEAKHVFTFRCLELDLDFETREFQTPGADLDRSYVPFPFRRQTTSELPQALGQDVSNRQAGLLWGALWIKPHLLKATGAIDHFGVIPNRCGLLSGWVVTQSGWEVWLVDEKGNAETLDAALRYQRNDIITMFRNQFGQHTVDAGFMMQWPHPMQSNDSIYLLAYNPLSQKAFEILKSAPEEVSEDPEGYVRWAFNIATPADKINERLNRWEGKFVETLLAEQQVWFEAHSRPTEVQVLGSPPEAPTISLIIPLYARWDFVEHQLLTFVQDRHLLETTEIIYVVDDPGILSDVLLEAENLYRLYEAPFKVVWGHRNRGFSGANNLGVSVSKGRQVLLLNSDAFPTRPGWANRMGELLDANPKYGLLGARLLNPEGSMQHAGMMFFYSSAWQVWLNKHPLAGLAPEFDTVPLRGEIVDKPAVTGACLIMTRALFDELGGLDEGYLIGDFEDSDLCLKVIDHGHRIGYVPSVELVHLERQSFSAVGDTSFRTMVVRFNAWRHTQRWGTLIESVSKGYS